MQIKRSNTDIISINPLPSSKYSKAIMGEETVTLVWEQATITALNIGDYIEYNGAKFTLNKLPNIKKVATNKWEYNAVFQSPLYELLKANYLLFDNTSTPPQGEFPLTGTASAFITLLVANLNRVAGSILWFVGDVDVTETVTMTFSNENCYSVLGRLADQFKTEYNVSGNTIHLATVSRTTSLVMEYGSTLYDIERTSVDNSDIITRLYVYGGERNIAAGYRGGSKRLLLPSVLYMEANVSTYGVIERCVTFDDIYPRLGATLSGTVTGVGSDIFSFVDSHLDFDINSCLIPGTQAKVRFTTGQCAGYDMQISSYIHSAKTITVIANTDDKNNSIPNSTFYPAIGDKYVLLDIVMPDSYRSAAETELQTKATDYLSKNSVPKVAYRGTFSSIYAKVNAPDLRCSDVVTIVDSDFGVNQSIRVTKITRGIVDFYNIQFEISDTVSKSTLTRIDDNIQKNNLGIITANAEMKQRFNSAYRNLDELRKLVFDTDGYFDPENIKPLSIETSMLSVGAKSQQLQTDIVFKPNDGVYTTFSWSSGSIVHFGIDDSGVKTWNVSSGFMDGMADDDFPAYIYAKCSRTTSAGEIVLNQSAHKFDFEPDYYWFLLGILHSPISGVCGISLTYGQTVINGQYIRTGIISSVDGSTYFNLNTGDIKAGLNELNGDGSGSLADGKISWDALNRLIIAMNNFSIDIDGNVDISGKFKTGNSGQRIVIDPETQTIKIYDSLDRVVISLVNFEDDGSYGYIKLNKYIGSSTTISDTASISALQVAAYFGNFHDITIPGMINAYPAYSPSTLHRVYWDETTMRLVRSNTTGL